MKILNSNIIFVCLVMLGVVLPSFGQQVDLRMAARKDCAANTYCVTIQLKSVQGNLNIGTADFMLSYEPSVVKYRDFLAVNFDKSYHPNSAWDYCAVDGRSQSGLFHLTTELLDPSGRTSQIKTNKWQSVGTLCFDMIQHDVSPALTFLETNLQINKLTPNDGTAAISVRNAKGIDKKWALSCVHQPEVIHDFVGEAGSVFTGQALDTWNKVVLKKTYQNPVVVANVSSYLGGDPVHIRLRNTTPNSFEFKMEEWDYADGSHTAEKVDYLVVEAGLHTLTNGTMIQAGIAVNGADWQAHEFSLPFTSTPIVAAQIASDNFTAAANTRIQKVGKTQFELMLQSEENNAVSGILPTGETVHWIAMQKANGKMEKSRFFEAGIFPKAVSNEWQIQRFKKQWHRSAVLIGQMQTAYDTDPADLRFHRLTARSVEMKVQEESSLSNALAHNPEQVGYMLFEEGMLEANWKFGFPPDIIGEAGKVEINQENAWQWQRVITRNSYQNPVIVVQAHTFNGSEPIVARVRKIHERRFDIMLQEWQYLDGSHLPEEVSWVVMEAGNYTLPNGKMIEAGTVTATKNFGKKSFETTFNVAPHVVTQIASGNSWIPVVERLSNIDARGFQAQIVRQEKNRAAGDHPPAENLDYIAMEPMIASTSVRSLEAMASENVINHEFKEILFNQVFSKPPVVLTDMQTYHGSDVSGLRIDNLTAEGFQVKVEEEQSRDEEVEHALETIACIAFEEGFIAAFHNDFQPCIGQKGKVLKEMWANIPGVRIDNLHDDPRFPNAPSIREEVSSLKSPINFGNKYGTRIRGFISPPHSGYFTFNMTGDDQTAFFLSTDANPENAVRQAYVKGWTRPKQHNKYQTQTSERIYLTAGRMYFFDIHHKENYGGDHFNVYWKWGNRDWADINNRYLYSYECGPHSSNAQIFTFEVTHNGEDADLYWSIENETNSDYFQIQTAVDLNDFADETFDILGIEAGSGQGMAEHTNLYHFEHYIQTETEARYYRIAQFHLDGTTSYSPIRSIYLDRSDELIHVYPNPFAERVTIVFPDKLKPKSNIVDIEITNGLGQVVYQAEGNLQTSRVYELTLGEEFMAGIYQISVQTEGIRMMTRKVVKVK